MLNSDHERERFAVVLFYGVVLLVGYLSFQVIGPFLVPLGWGAILAMVLNPLRARLARHVSAGWAAALTTLATIVVFIVPAVIVGTLLVHEVAAQAQSANAQQGAMAVPARIQEMWDQARAEAPFLNLPADPSVNLKSSTQVVATWMAGRMASILTNVAVFVLQLFIMLFAVFYFLRDGGAIVEIIRHLLPFEEGRRNRIIHDTYELVVATVGASFTVALAQGALTGIALAALGFSAPILWSVVASFASLLPAVGAALVWAPAAIWLFVTGDVVRGVIMVVVGVGVISMVDNVMKPILLSGRTSMHGLLVFLSLMGGVAAFGFIGLVVGPVVVATATTLIETVLPQKTEGPTES